MTIIFSLAISGCQTDTDDSGKNPPDPGKNEPAKYAAEFRGEWIRMDTGDHWYISGNSIHVNGAGTPWDVAFTKFVKTSANVAVATAGNQKYTLFAARTANASFNAEVVLLDDTSRSVTARAAVERPKVKVVNPKQPDLPPLIVQPNDDTGKIFVPNRIPGDTLEIVPESSEWGSTKVGLTPGFGSDQNLGVIPLTKGDNFKVTARMGDAAEDITELYADMVPRDYIFELENIGATNTGDSGWELSWNEDDFVFISGTKKEDFPNIAPGNKKQLTLRLASRPITAEYKNKEIKVKIRNYDSRSQRVRTWDDTVSINYYKTLVPLKFVSEKQVQGIIKTGRGKSYYFRTGEKGDAITVNVPWSNDAYTIAFLGATIESESATKYFFTKDRLPNSINWSSLNQREFLSKYKPDNEFEDSAPAINLGTEEGFMGYLAGDSIDYYRVKLGNTPPVGYVYTVTFNSNNATSGTAPAAVTWGNGVTIQLPDKGDLERTGYVFDGWSLNSSGTGTKYSAGSSYIITGDVTLYAKWGIPYTVTFDKNTTAAGSSEANPQTKTLLTPAYNLGSLPQPPSWPGYTFDGWNTRADGSGTAFTATSDVTANLTVYARWRENIVPGANLAEKLTWLRTNAASNNEYTIEVIADETIGPNSLSYSGKTNVTVQIKGDTETRTVSFSSSNSMFTVGSGVTLILGNNITLKGYSGNNYSLVRINSGGCLVTRDGSLITGNVSSQSGGGVYVSGTFNMEGGKISENTVTGNGYVGGGVYVKDGTFTMSGGEISRNTALSGGNGVYVGENGTFTMSGGKISDNTGSSGGSGVILSGKVTFTMSGGTISGNNGSGVAVYNGGTFTMSGGEIFGNTDFWNGGGVHVAEGIFTKTGGTIYGYDSGDAKSNVVINKSGVVQNNAGHAVYVYKSSIINYRRETTAGPTVNLDSSKAGAAGGWE